MTFKDKITPLKEEYNKIRIDAINIYSDLVSLSGIEIGLVDRRTMFVQHFWDAPSLLSHIENKGVDEKFEIEQEIEGLLQEKKHKTIDNETYRKEYLDRLEKRISFLGNQIMSLKIYSKMFANTELRQGIESVIDKYYYTDYSAPDYDKIRQQRTNEIALEVGKIIAMYRQALPLGDFCKIVERKTTLLPQKTYRYIVEEDLDDTEHFTFEKTRKASGKDLTGKIWRVLKENDILLYKRQGWDLIAKIVTKSYEDTLVGEDMTILSVGGSLLPAMLTCFFHESYFKDLIEKDSIDNINKESLLKIKVPIPEMEVQNFFHQHMSDYFMYYQKELQLNRLITEAEKIYTEQGEQAALYFLEMKEGKG